MDFQIWHQHKIKEPKPNGFGSFMELLARFELATRLREIYDFTDTSRPQIEILTAYAVRADEVASSSETYTIKNQPSRLG